MKSIIRAIIAAALLAALAVNTALAVTLVTGHDADIVSYTIDELDMTIDLPSDLIVFTRTIDPEDPNLIFFALEKEWLDVFFQENDVYLNAISEKITYELYVTMTTGSELEDIDDFCDCTDSYLHSFIQNYEDLYKNSGETYTKTEIYRNESTAYIKSYSESSETGYCASYFTVKGRKAFSIILYCYDKAVTPEREAILTKAVDSVSFPEFNEHNAASEASPEPLTPPSQSPAASPSQDSYSTAQPPQTNDTARQSEPDNPKFLNLLLPALYFCVTFTLVTLPIAVYRYIIKRQPVSKKRAALTASIYGALVCFAAAVYIYFAGHVLLIAGVILWSFVNYFILSCGKERLESPSPKKEESMREGIKDEAYADIAGNKPCGKCFAINLADSDVCFFCGAKLDDNATAKK